MKNGTLSSSGTDSLLKISINILDIMMSPRNFIFSSPMAPFALLTRMILLVFIASKKLIVESG
jgi:hypothetical protein